MKGVQDAHQHATEEDEEILDDFRWEPWMDDELQQEQVPWKEPKKMHHTTFYCDLLNARVSISGVATAPVKWREPPVDSLRTKEYLRDKKKKGKYVAPLMTL